MFFFHDISLLCDFAVEFILTLSFTVYECVCVFVYCLREGLIQKVSLDPCLHLLAKNIVQLQVTY